MAEVPNWLARITCPAWSGGQLVLGTDWQWVAHGPIPPGVLQNAQFEAETYEYSTSHGFYPGTLAADVARDIAGARVEYPPLPPEDPDAVY